MEVESQTIIYLLTNPAMPGLVKIGRTDRDTVESRLSELYTTGVPVPFDCYYACRADPSKNIEQGLHKAFDPNRVNPRREFFEIEPDQAKVILEMLAIEDVTPEVAKELGSKTDVVDQASGKRLSKKRRPPLNFEKMDIPNGSILQWKEGMHEVRVVAPKKVIFNDAETSLTRVTSDILARGYDVQPIGYWLYEGRLLSDIYEDTYPQEF